jgi:hypothetical protein
MMALKQFAPEDNRQEGPEGPGSLTLEIGQKVKLEPRFTPEAQFENKEQLNLNNYLYCHQENICVNLFQNCASGLDVVSF